MTLYGQFCPVALGAEIFAQRWTPLILRELLMGARSFSDIHRGVPRISKNLLAQRLESLRGSGIIEQLQDEAERKHLYRLTGAGRALGPVIDALGIWGYNWASKDLEDDHLDPDFLMWTLRRMVRVDAIPDERIVIAFRFRKHEDRVFWLVLAATRGGSVPRGPRLRGKPRGRGHRRGTRPRVSWAPRSAPCGEGRRYRGARRAPIPLGVVELARRDAVRRPRQQRFKPAMNA